MRVSYFAKLVGCAIVLCAATGASAQGDVIADIQKQIDELKKQGGYKVNTGALAIESWLLTATAIDKSAAKIAAAVAPAVQRLTSHGATLVETISTAVADDGADQRTERAGPAILVMTAAEVIDFTQVAMIESEIGFLQSRFDAELGSPPALASSSAIIPLAGALIGLFKSETEITAVEQKVDSKLLAAAVARRIGERATLPSAVIVAQGNGALIGQFAKLTKAADDARPVRDALAVKPKKTPAEQGKLDRLTALLTRFDAFFARVTTAANGVVPLTHADRLHGLIDDEPYIVRVNVEQAGGTLLKRTNVVTALGGESTFISGGLVSSYQMTDPRTGRVLNEGVITCRTTLTSLKRVQEGSWKSSEGQNTAVCLP